MRKFKILITLIIGFSLFFTLNMKANDEIIDPPIIEVNKDKLPTNILIGTVDELNLFNYFRVRDNGEVINLEAGDSSRTDDVWWELDDDGFKVDVLGTYAITLFYSAKDGKLYINELIIVITDEDTIAPVFDSIVENSYNYEVNDIDNLERLYRRFIAIDNVDGTMTLSSNEDLINYENVKIDTLGSYVVVIRFEDNAGNVLEKEITINIEDTRPPIIILNRLLTTKKGVEVDYKAHISYSDNYDKEEDLVALYTYEFAGNESSNIDFSKVGEHKVTIKVTDVSGNFQIETFKIIVENSISFGVLILIINASVLLLGGVLIGLRYLIKVLEVRSKA